MIGLGIGARHQLEDSKVEDSGKEDSEEEDSEGEDSEKEDSEEKERDQMIYLLIFQKNELEVHVADDQPHAVLVHGEEEELNEEYNY